MAQLVKNPPAVWKTWVQSLDWEDAPEKVNPEGNQPWIFTGRTDAEAEAPILWPLDAKNQLLLKIED